MEGSFTDATNALNSMEEALKSVNHKEIAQESTMFHQQIEIYFDEICQVLAARKYYMLCEVDKELEKRQISLVDKIKLAKQCMEIGQALFSNGRINTALENWKEVRKMHDEVLRKQIYVDLPASLVENIKVYGNVYTGESEKISALPHKATHSPPSHAQIPVENINIRSHGSVPEKITLLPPHPALPFISVTHMKTHKEANSFLLSPTQITYVSAQPPILPKFSCPVSVTTVANLILQGEESPMGMIYNTHDKHLYVTFSAPASRVKKVTLTGKVVAERIDVLCGGCGFGGIAIRKDEILVATDSRIVTKIHLTGRGSRPTSFTGRNFTDLRGIAVDQQTGNVYISDEHTIHQIKQGVVTTLAGGKPGNKDGCGANARFLGPHGICFNPAEQMLLVCDSGNNKVRTVTSTGEVKTIANIPHPRDIVVTSDGTVIVTSSFSGSLVSFLVKQNGHYELIKRLGKPGHSKSEDEEHIVQGNECAFAFPQGIAVDEEAHICYVVEKGGAIRKVTFQ